MQEKARPPSSPPFHVLSPPAAVAPLRPFLHPPEDVAPQLVHERRLFCGQRLVHRREVALQPTEAGRGHERRGNVLAAQRKVQRQLACRVHVLGGHETSERTQRLWATEGNPVA